MFALCFSADVNIGALNSFAVSVLIKKHKDCAIVLAITLETLDMVMLINYSYIVTN